MSLYFRSICSSSAGNCLALWSDSTKLLIDCGLSSMKRTRAALTSLFDDPTQIDSVLLTHTHSDHIAYYPLRVLDEYGLMIRLHDDCVNQLADKHFREYAFKNVQLKPYKSKAFTVGDFHIQPFEVAHNPYYPTYGYQIRFQDTKIVIATDFCDWGSVFEYFVDADFIFVESNHNLELLRQYYNPNSRFHLPNPDAGEMLVTICQESQKPPQQVILGHLSDQRNEPAIALQETRQAFQDAGVEMNFNLDVAPLRQPSEILKL